MEPAPATASLTPPRAGYRIRSVRLRDVKSFGPGAEGRGLTIRLERGLNRIAGPNGSGKTTLIEALGYALFDCAPETGSRVELDSVFVRQGADEGEIEVELVAAEGLLRVRRGVGKRSKQRWTISDESGFITHETEDEVKRFLAAAAGLPHAAHLPEHFRKLVGVRQGRFIDPFEFTPVEARRYFAPILDVEIYERCFHDLKDAGARLALELQEALGNIKVARAEAEFNAGAEQEAAELERRIAEAKARLEAQRAALHRAREGLAQCEIQQQAVQRTAQALSQAQRELTLADQAAVERSAQLQRAEDARKILESTAEEHARYLKAEGERREIAARRAEYERFRERLSQLQQRKAAAETRAQEADRLARELREDGERRGEDLAVREAQLQARRGAFEASHAEPPAPGAAGDETLRACLAEAERWALRLGVAAERCREAGRETAEANRALASFDPDVGIRANEACERLRTLHEQARLELERVQARRDSRRELTRQLEEGRVCPLLAERCRQFDAGKLVLTEVQFDEMLEAVQAKAQQAEGAWQAADARAKTAQREIEKSKEWLQQADRALKELDQQRRLAGDLDAREAFDELARNLGEEAARAPLPDVPELPPPGEQPWEALERAPKVAQAFCAYAEAYARPLAAWAEQLEARRRSGEERRRLRELERQRLEQEEQALAERRADLEQRRERWQAQRRAASEALAETEKLKASIDDLAKQQSGVAGLDAREAEAQRTLEACREPHLLYIAAENDAARLAQARADLAVAVGELERAKGAAATALRERDTAAQAYHAGAHEAARNLLQEAMRAFGGLEKDLERDEQQRVQALQRVERRKAALERLRVETARKDLVEARRDLLDHARWVLRQAGPRVAEQLVRAVTERAQRIYNALSPLDPGQLHWDHEHYELRVATSTGLRRFAMLSGGQKIKAVLAVQLALVQQFSAAGLCIFDEPTYGLDAESRQLLAAALVEAQRVSGFEQLIVVSHDDAF
ncbi:MAG: SMC family ATPase [Planctomycetota bacterium]|nr:SMC family ATPase [Planctomycetota bacterium]